MESLRKLLAFGCALGIAGCAQSGMGGSPGALAPGGSMLPSPAHAASPLGLRRRTSPGGPEIYVFRGAPDAQVPLTGVTNISSTLYGTTYYGGANNEGALYSVTTGGAESVMHSFPTGSSDGFYPDAALTAVNGTLYGTTYYGGTYGHGTIFSITPSNVYKVIYNFGSTSSDCSNPDSSLTYVAGKNALYGITHGGGADGEACVFKLKLSRKPVESVFYSFTGSSTSPTNVSALVLYNNAFYGTSPGGGASGYGTVFKLTLTGQESLVYSFKNEPDGANPYAALTVLGNTLYGTTIDGGQGACGGYAGCGIVFKMTPAGKETVLHRFVDSPSQLDGDDPQSPLIAVGGALYGVTANCSGNACDGGVVFSVTPSGSESVIYDFAPPPSDPPGYPQSPSGSIVSLNGTIYGTSATSIVSGYGTVYAVAQ